MTWTCLSPKTTMMITVPLPLAVLVSYALLNKDFLPNSSQSSPKELKSVKYSIVGSTSDTMDQDAPSRQKHVAKCSTLHGKWVQSIFLYCWAFLLSISLLYPYLRRFLSPIHNFSLAITSLFICCRTLSVDLSVEATCFYFLGCLLILRNFFSAIESGFSQCCRWHNWLSWYWTRCTISSHTSG